MRQSGWMMAAAVAVLATMPAGIARAQAQSSQQSPAPAKPKPSGTTAPARKPAAPVSSYDRALLRPALLTAKAPESYQVKFTTTRGDFVVTVTRAWAPVGADRFYNLAKHHFYDNASFFRVLPNFVVQFGINAYPPVSAAWSKATIKDDPVTQTNKKGSITFATAGADTRTTQVFINLVDNKRLDGSGFAPFGQVTEGMNVVELMYEGYGEGAPGGAGPNQDLIEKQGKAYLDKSFPKLDFVKSATLAGPVAVPPAKSAPTAKPAAAAKKPQ